MLGKERSNFPGMVEYSSLRVAVTTYHKQLKTTPVYYLGALEVRVWGQGAGHFLPSLQEEPSCLLQLLVAPTIPGLVAASRPSLPPSSHGLSSARILVSSLGRLFTRTRVI